MIKSYLDKKPDIHETAFIAETANVIGDVKIGKNASVWYNTVLRGDGNSITLGENSNVQDNTTVHISSEFPTIIGANVTIGHNAIVHACTIGDFTIIGMGAIILNGAEIGSETIIGAGSLVPMGKKIPSGVLAIGSPVKVIRELTQKEKDYFRESAEEYVKFGRNHKK